MSVDVCVQNCTFDKVTAILFFPKKKFCKKSDAQMFPPKTNIMTRSVGEELTRASDLLDGTKTDVISFFDEVGSLMIVVIG